MVEIRDSLFIHLHPHYVNNYYTTVSRLKLHEITKNMSMSDMVYNNYMENTDKYRQYWYYTTFQHFYNSEKTSL